MSTANGRRHVCDPLACGIFYDARCPVWALPEAPVGSPAWHTVAGADEVRDYRRGQRLAAFVRAHADVLIPALLDVMQEPLAELVGELVADLLADWRGRRA
jgi:hypothetical protein